MQNPHNENTTQSWWVGSVGKVRTWGPRIHANPDSYTHLQCQHSDEEVGDRDKRNPRRCTLLWRTRDPFSNKKDSRNRHLRLSTYTPWHTQTHAHVLRHKNMHSCIHTHSHTQRLKKYSMAFETKTLASSCCLTSNPLIQHHYPLVSLASDSPCICPLSQWAASLFLPVLVLARCTSAKWMSSVRSGDFLHKQL